MLFLTMTRHEISTGNLRASFALGKPDHPNFSETSKLSTRNSLDFFAPFRR
jgi:hypothetical protein